MPCVHCPHLLQGLHVPVGGQQRSLSCSVQLELLQDVAGLLGRPKWCHQPLLLYPQHQLCHILFPFLPKNQEKIGLTTRAEGEGSHRLPMAQIQSYVQGGAGVIAPLWRQGSGDQDRNVSPSHYSLTVGRCLGTDGLSPMVSCAQIRGALEQSLLPQLTSNDV